MTEIIAFFIGMVIGALIVYVNVPSDIVVKYNKVQNGCEAYSSRCEDCSYCLGRDI